MPLIAIDALPLIAGLSRRRAMLRYISCYYAFIAVISIRYAAAVIDYCRFRRYYAMLS